MSRDVSTRTYEHVTSTLRITVMLFELFEALNLCEIMQNDVKREFVMQFMQFYFKY